MKRPRSSIAMWMGVIGIVAVNLAIGRVLYAFLPWKLAGAFGIGVFLQVGLFCLICSRGQPRHYGFWAGVEFGGLLGLTSFLYARVPDSWLGTLWESYAAHVDRLMFELFGFGFLSRGPEDPVLLATIAIFAFLPQFLMAVLGGLIGLAIAWRGWPRRLLIRLVAIGVLMAASTYVWVGAWSVLPAQPPWIYVGIAPGVLLLQIGLYGLLRSWKAPRAAAFWVGFLMAGALVFWSYALPMVTAHVAGTPAAAYLPGGLSSQKRLISADGLRISWLDYTAAASRLVGRSPQGTFQVVWSGKPVDSLVYFLIVLLPHLLAALAGGGLTLLVAWIAAIRARPAARAG